MWYYNKGDYNRLNDLIQSTEWSFIEQEPINTVCETFHAKLLDILHMCIPSKLVTVRPNDKPWYNSAIRRKSRKRDRQKQIAIRANNTNNWKIYKQLRNKVNNMKKHVRTDFFPTTWNLMSVISGLPILVNIGKLLKC